MALPLIPLALGVAALWGGSKLLNSGKSKIRYPGEAAQVGDDIFVAPRFLTLAEVPALPPGTLYVILSVKVADGKTLKGPIVGFGDQKVPAEIGYFTVQRSDPFKVMRKGKLVAENTGATIGFGAEG